ncbi:MAG: hypothetical protein HFJ17_00660 [Clostridia bacterium]|nr:hypothetical protein [Clostridia bacterium]
MTKEIITKISKHKEVLLEILIILLVILFAFSITPKRLQNDTFYTIAIGKLINENGIDMQEHFTWHQGLPYTYPHWLYDVIIYAIYAMWGFTGIYVSTCILASILGITIYKVNSSLTKNKIISFAVTIGSLYLLKGYITARAQLVTFILFMLILYNIEKFIQTKHKRNVVALVIIPCLIANLHAAVWPFTFVLYLPYIAEYLICTIADFIIYRKFKLWRLTRKVKKMPEKQEELNKLEEQVKRIKEKRQSNLDNPYKIKMERNNNVILLIVIMIVVLFTGLLTPIGDTPYTYTYLTMKGSTMENINEHLPLTLINNVPIMCTIVLFLALLIFTKTKIRLSDLFMLGGLTYLMFSTRRQSSMFALICSVILTRLVIQLLDLYGIKQIKGKAKKYINAFIVFLLLGTVVIAFSINNIKKKQNAEYINKETYPVEATEWILNNLDVKNIKLYNEYNYGSYLAFKGIPVFIDSRADVYDPMFNARTNKDMIDIFTESGEEGQNIFGDFIGTSNISKYYGTTFEKYGVTHIIIKSNSKVNMIIRKADSEKYKKLYSDDNFIIYEILEY